MPSRSRRYSGNERPACRMNHTGVCGTGSRRQALRNAESYVASRPACGRVADWELGLMSQIFARAERVTRPAGCAFPAAPLAPPSLPSMAAAHEHPDDGSDGAGGEGVPDAFRHAVAGLSGVRPRPEVEIEVTTPPRRLAPFSYALEAAVADEAEEELAEGRLVLLHDPAGHDAWNGTFRLVTLVTAALEPEMGSDPLLPEVCWSWLTGALQTRGLSYREPSGTVTRASSQHFGGLGDREPTTRIEIRASWTPAPPPVNGAAPDTAAHLAAWCDLLCQVAGLPPSDASEAAQVVTLPQRRGAHPG